MILENIVQPEISLYAHLELTVKEISNIVEENKNHRKSDASVTNT